jgi:hypothetical protein
MGTIISELGAEQSLDGFQAIRRDLSKQVADALLSVSRHGPPDGLLPPKGLQGLLKELPVLDGTE